MEINMGAGEWLVVILSIGLATWFLVGNYINNRKSQQMLTSLVKSSSSIGKINSARFLASTSAGYRAMIKLENSPISQVEVVMGLLRRENLPLWLFQLITRKRDLLTLHFMLRDQPKQEYWAFPANKAPTLVEHANRGRQGPLIFREESADYRIYSGSSTESLLLGNIKDFLSTFPTTRFLVMQKKVPHLSFAVPANELKDSAIGDLFDRVDLILK